MSILVDDLRDAAMPPICARAADKIEDIERAYELLFKEAAALRKDAERYHKWRADYTSHADVQISDLLLGLADAWTADEVDSAIDATPAVGAA